VDGTAAHGREFALSSDAGVSQGKHSVRRVLQDADTMLVLGARDNEIQLEEGLPWSRGDLHARGHVDGLYHTGRGHRSSDSMPGYPEYVHLQYRQVTVRQNGSWEI
jgi:hypothetical protein